jgi:molybdopterin molybdotransferase
MSDLPDYAHALGRALSAASALDRTERVRLEEASDRVLAEPIVADRDLPPFNRAAMDGYAVRSAEIGQVEAFPVAGRVAAGEPADIPIPPGHCVAIATGAPVPDGLDAVIQHELSDRGDPVRFRVSQIEPFTAIHRRGADAGHGRTLIEPGTRLRAHHLGIAATVGCSSVTVRTRPHAIVLSSGDEVVEIDADVAPQQIRNSNGPQMMDLLRRFGADPIDHRHVRDELRPTTDAVGDALARCDLLVTIGGISAGDRDHFPAAFDAHDVERRLHGAAIRPGKPILVGTVPSGTVVVGIPGNPVSCLACACLFIQPTVRVQLGVDPILPWRFVTLESSLRANPNRRVFRPAVLRDESTAAAPDWAGSGDLAHTAVTDGLLELPVQAEPVEAGTHLRFLPWP